MLKFKKNGEISIDGEVLSLSKEDTKMLLLGSLGEEVILEDNIKISEFINSVYEIKEFINAYFMDEYEAARALVNMGEFNASAKHLRAFKSIEKDKENFLYVNNTSEIIFSDDCKSKKIKDLEFLIEKEAEDTDKLLKVKVFCKFSLLDLLSVIFEDLLYTVRNEPVLL